MRSIRGLLGLLLAALAMSAAFAASRAAAAPLSPDNLGVNAANNTDLSIASAAGLGVVRNELIQGTNWNNADSIVTLYAEAHMRLAPVLGLPHQLTPSAAASAMASYVSAFAQRYGAGGTFWSQNPQLPYFPVEDFEIGNEPNIPLQWIADETNLHWSDPSGYAQVYEASRAALHQVDPTGVAVVGGLADSGALGVDLQHDEEWLAALTPGTVDAVGLHPYTYPVSFAEMYSDTQELRQWMDANGMQNAPIDVDEMGACDILPQDTLNTGSGCEPSISSSAWGTFAANYTDWALCSSALNVSSIQPEYWGDNNQTDVDAILPFVDGSGNLTPYGQDFLNLAQSLTTNGCSLGSASSPSISGEAMPGSSLTASNGGWTGSPTAMAYQWELCNGSGNCSNIPGATSATYQVGNADVGYELVASVTASNASGSAIAWSNPVNVTAAPSAPSGGGSGSGGGSSSGGGGGSPVAYSAQLSMLLRLLGVHLRGSSLTVNVHANIRSGHVYVVARKGARRVHLRLNRRRGTSLTFTGRLSAGRWTLVVTCSPPAGYAASAPLRHNVTVP